MAEVQDKMSVETIKAIIENPNVNGFVSYQEQYMIYDTLLSSGINPFGSSVLHYGCGNGEFVRYSYSKLSEQQRQSTTLVNYKGIDKRTEVVEAANSVYDYLDNVEFTTDDLDTIEDNSFDWSIAPHLFIYKDPEAESDMEVFESSIDKLYNISKFGVLLTMLKSDADFSDDELELVFAPDRVELYRILQSKYKNVTIIDNYSDTEYTIFIHKFEK